MTPPPPERRSDPVRSVLFGSTGLHIGGGIASVGRCIARVLEDRAAEGGLDRVDRVLLLDDPADPAAPPRHGVQRLSRGSQSRFVWQLWREYRRRRHDLVLFDLVGLARGTRLPLPGFPPPRIAIFVHGDELAAAERGPRARALLAARRVLANSAFTAARVGRLHPGLGDRVRTVPLCIDPERTAEWEAVETAPAPPREPAALIVGRMWSVERGKGHDELIAAWPKVRARAPAAELWVVGAGDDRPRLEAEARKAGVADAVRFLGRVSDAELGALYRRASVFAMPSRQEGFGLVYAEAMWHGLPCIGSTADAASQVIAEGETGCLVPYGDVAAIERAVGALLTDPDAAARMGEAGRRRAREHFGYPRFRRELLAALELE